MLVFDCQNEEAYNKFIEEYNKKLETLEDDILQIEQEEAREAEEEEKERLKALENDKEFKEFCKFIDSN